MPTQKKKIKKLLFQMRYLEEELEEIQSIYDTASAEFSREVRQLHYDLNVYDEDFDSTYSSKNISNQDNCAEHAQEAKEVSSSEKTIHPPWAKKIFRNIVRDTHPDHFPKNIRDSKKRTLTEIYKKTVENYNSKNYADLLETALRLGIDVGDVSDNQIVSVKNSVLDIQRKISVIKNSLYWQWAHADKNLKESILEKFMKMRGWTSKESLRTRSRSGPGKHPGKSIAWVKKRFKRIHEIPSGDDEKE